jgi:hypothetical protein
MHKSNITLSFLIFCAAVRLGLLHDVLLRTPRPVGSAADTNQLTNWLTPWRQNPLVHRRIYQSPPPDPILSQLDQLYTLPANLPKICSDTILPSTPWSSEWSPSFELSHPNPVRFPLLFHACHISRPPHSSWFDLANNIWGWVLIMNLYLCSFLHSPDTSSLFGPNILLRTLFPNTLSLFCSLHVETKFHTHAKQMTESWFSVF